MTFVVGRSVPFCPATSSRIQQVSKYWKQRHDEALAAFCQCAGIDKLKASIAAVSPRPFTAPGRSLSFAAISNFGRLVQKRANESLQKGVLFVEPSASMCILDNYCDEEHLSRIQPLFEQNIPFPLSPTDIEVAFFPVCSFSRDSSNFSRNDRHCDHPAWALVIVLFAAKRVYLLDTNAGFHPRRDSIFLSYLSTARFVSPRLDLGTKFERIVVDITNGAGTGVFICMATEIIAHCGYSVRRARTFIHEALRDETLQSCLDFITRPVIGNSLRSGLKRH